MDFFIGCNENILSTCIVEVQQISYLVFDYI